MLQGRLTGRVSVALGLAPHAGLPSSSPTALENRRQTTKEPRDPATLPVPMLHGSPAWDSVSPVVPDKHSGSAWWSQSVPGLPCGVQGAVGCS